MKRFALVLFYLVGVYAVLCAQDILLFNEDFEGNNSAFTVNTDGSGSNTGDNQWVVNNAYSGAPTYLNTTPQNQTNGGTISFAPNSNYLHVHDAPSGIANSNYNPGASSDRFARMSTSVCTLGMDNVHLSFFYLCQGSATAFGTLWYSIEGGAWTQFGAGQYSGMTNWQYVDLTDPLWSNVGDLRFGFRWQNDASGPPETLSFAVDDVTVVATYSVTDPVTINITNIAPNPVCQGEFISISYQLSQPLCTGNYQIELSNAAGNFPSPFGSWVFSINYPNTTGTVSVQLPTNAQPGDCYRIRINRMSPPPVITGVSSACFEIIECPNIITTLQPVVTFDDFPVCIDSAIDVPFTSTGVFQNNNQYIAQLSGPDGEFAANPPVIGSSFDDSTYDPALGQDPGTVAGLVPTTEPGCNYYIRVVSTSPVAVGAVWGPFCIQECDITTNGTVDLDFCVYGCDVQPDGVTHTITIEINSFDNEAAYPPGNVFTTQLLSSEDFTQIGPMGIFGSVEATSSTTLEITVPCFEELQAMGIPTGMNYLRIVGSSSTTPDNLLGTLIRVTIGVFKPDPLVVQSYAFPGFQPQDVFCSGQTVQLQFQPFNFNDNSSFQWQSNALNGGAPFTSPSGPNSNNLFIITGPPGELTFRVQETNFGCVGGWSEWHTVTVLGQPSATITGPSPICDTDTAEFQVPFYPNTYYGWSTSAPPGTIAYQDTSNNILNIGFSQPGNYTLNISVLNACGSANASTNVIVNASPDAVAGDDQLICIGESAQLQGQTIPNGTYAWSLGPTTVGTSSSVSVSPSETSSYVFTATSANGCSGTDTVLVEVQLPDPPSIIEDEMCEGGFNELSLFAPLQGQHSWSTGANGASVVVNNPGTYTLSTAIAGQICPTLTEFQVNPIEPEPPIVLGDSICNGLANELVLTAPSVGIYQWSTGDDQSTTVVGEPGVYTLEVFTPGAICQTVYAFEVGTFEPGAPELLVDSICPDGQSSIFLGSPVAGQLYLWSGGESTPSIEVSEDGTYALEVYQPGQACQRLFEWLVLPAVPPDPIVVPDSVCPGGPSRIRLMGDAQGTYQWSTGSIFPYLDVNDTGVYVLNIFTPGEACPRTLEFVITPDTCFAIPLLDVFVPNAITIDGDNLNEVFKPVFSDPEWLVEYSLIIVNRWGELVFESTDHEEHWIGNHQGGAYFVDVNVFAYLLTYRSIYSPERVRVRGHVTVIR